MLLTVTTTAPDATDLGYLLHKNPSTIYERPLPFGIVRVFYPTATDTITTAALQVTVDPIQLVRGGDKRNAPRTLAQYVSDRPYAPSSFLSVAIAEAFGTAMNGRSKERPQRVDEKLPLAATLYALACDAGDMLIRRLFEPLGYVVEIDGVSRLLDDRFPQWGIANIFTVRLSAETTVADLLKHLYVLIPVLDNAKHYTIGADEVEKLVQRGDGWLNIHPEKELIAKRYLRYRRNLTDAALERLADVEGATEAVADTETANDAAEESLERKARLHDRRIETAVACVKELPDVKTVVDLGCGSGQTLAVLLKEMPALQKITGMDISSVALQQAERRLHLDRLPDYRRNKIDLLHCSLVYRDTRLTRYDVAILTEVIEHIEPDRLPTVERVVWEFAARAVLSSPHPIPNTTPFGNRCPRASFGTAITASSGHAHSSRHGQTVWRHVSDIG